MPERIARGRPRALMRLACKLLGKLHEYLNSSLYAKEMESRFAAATKVKAFVFTGTNLTKIMALKDALRHYIPNDLQLWLFRDEYQQEKAVSVVSSLRDVLVFLGVGDPGQTRKQPVPIAAEKTAMKQCT